MVSELMTTYLNQSTDNNITIFNEHEDADYGNGIHDDYSDHEDYSDHMDNGDDIDIHNDFSEDV